MKTMRIAIILLILSFRAYSPGNKVVSVYMTEPIQPYEAIINAVVRVESGGNNYAYNALEGAYGAFQIRQVRLNDFNKKTGKHYRLVDMYDYNKSEEVFLYYCNSDYEHIAKSWNGSGPKTIDYWRKVKKVLLSL